MALQFSSEPTMKEDFGAEARIVDGTGHARDLRTALGMFATGVAVVTARGPDGRTSGLTINSFSSLSLDPPLVLWCLSDRAPSRSVFMNASHFAIHVLAEHQEQLSTRFSTPCPDKFAGLDLAEGLGGAPVLSGVSALFECERHHTYSGGDHTIFVGRLHRHSYCHRSPLVFHCGRYARLRHNTLTVTPPGIGSSS